MFFTWPALLPESIEVIGLQLPGRGRRLKEIPHTRMEPLVGSAKEAVIPLLDCPYAIFGHSVGALMGFELTRALAEEGYRPDHLFVSACSPPHLHAPDPLIHALPEAEFIAALKRLDGTPQEILQHDELMRQLIPALRADFAVSETYRDIGNPAQCPITAFGGVEDRIVPPERLPDWRQHTESAFDLVLLPGDHFYLSTSRGALLHKIGLILGVG
jgi:medium-chain acyl-[acyl-carrier-protein] hydrolase